jgi:hypothetical protein
VLALVVRSVRDRARLDVPLLLLLWWRRRRWLATCRRLVLVAQFPCYVLTDINCLSAGHTIGAERATMIDDD